MSRHSRIAFLLAALLIVGLLLGACQTAPAPATPAKAEAPKVEAPKTEAPKAAEPAKPAEAAKPVETKPADARPAEAPKAEAKPVAKEPYKIGVQLPLSGQAAAVGMEMRDVLTMEVERINAAGGINGSLIETVIEDDGFDPTRAATALTKLIRQDKVLAMVGPFGSYLEPSVRPVTEREQIVSIMPSPTMQDMRDKKFKWSFNTVMNEILGADAMLEIAKDNGYKKAAVVAESGLLYQAAKDRLKSEGQKSGMQVTSLEDTFGPKDVDLTPQVTKLKGILEKERPDVLFLSASGYGAATFSKGMKQLAVTLPVIAFHSVANPLTFALGGEEMSGILAPGSKDLVPSLLPDSDPQKALILDFQKRFQAKYNKPLQAGGNWAADSLSILVSALKVAGPDRAKIRDAVEKTNKLVGVSGIFTFSPDDHEGLGKDSVAVFKVDMKNKKFDLVKVLK